jgi:large conductance mechanosensitive channel
MNKQISGFMSFVREQGVVGLAVGLTLGGAVSKFVTALIEDIVNPIVGIVLGSTEGLAKMKFVIPGTKAAIMWGHLLSAALDFLVIAAVIYYVVHGLGLDRVDKKKDN